MKKKILMALGVIVLAGVGYYGYSVYQFVRWMDDLGDCGFASGPCLGEKIDFNLRAAKVDQYLDCPNGRIGFVHTQDTLTPIVFKIDKHSKLLWALRLESDSCSGIPLKQMSGMEILEDKGLKRIHFFNETYSEPGIIYLNDNYDFEYLCLSPM